MSAAITDPHRPAAICVVFHLEEMLKPEKSKPRKKSALISQLAASFSHGQSSYGAMHGRRYNSITVNGLFCGPNTKVTENIAIRTNLKLKE